MPFTFVNKPECIRCNNCSYHLARNSKRGKKTRQTEEEVGRQYQGMERPGVRQITEGSGEQGKMKKTGCKIIFGAPTTLTVKGFMMMMMKCYRTCTNSSDTSIAFLSVNVALFLYVNF